MMLRESPGLEKCPGLPGMQVSSKEEPVECPSSLLTRATPRLSVDLRVFVQDSF